MRAALACFVLGWCLSAEAHIGSPNVFFEGNAGEYPVRVVIRPPQVVPGLADITVRLPAGPVNRVTVLPVFSRAGRQGSPPPDEARLVRGETNLYSAALWLMKPGAYSVDVNVEGARGKGTLVVPVNSMATNTRPMSRGYGLMLSALGMFLFLGGLKIAGAVFGESGLPPGAVPTRKDRWLGRGAMLVAAGVLALMLFGGKKWWDFEDANYRNNALYKPFPVTARVRLERDQLLLTVQVDTADRRGTWTPLIPDHGKMMHLFLVRAGDPGAFAHVHPLPKSDTKFEVPLPPLPAGAYHVYADVTHEDGFAETLTAKVEIPSATPAMKGLWLGNSAEPICSAAVAQRLAVNLAFPPDPDDSWQMDVAGATSSRQTNRVPRDAAQPVTNATGGYKIVWENPGSLVKNLDASLRFRFFTPENQPALIEPYMGMNGHAVVRRQDGSVFAHVHPVGTFSMAAHHFFVTGKLPERTATNVPPGASPTDPSLPQVESHFSHTNQVSAVGEISFPYAFPQPGAYRLWVQARTQGRILTGVFDTIVAEEK